MLHNQSVVWAKIGTALEHVSYVDYVCVDDHLLYRGRAYIQQSIKMWSPAMSTYDVCMCLRCFANCIVACVCVCVSHMIAQPYSREEVVSVWQTAPTC